MSNGLVETTHPIIQKSSANPKIKGKTMMNPDQFRAMLKSLGLKQIAFAKWNGLNPRTVRRWASGEANVPRHIVAILVLLKAISEVGGPHLMKHLLQK